ncbi:TIGR00341 family protein [Coleofasciculus sp. LEGE 07092]|uniref:TIGR00341 family protein n=1 Tax=Coleofasciculus sp. LEGE 07092 TaxID=2777969 RepID=UPI001D146FE1|nr:TIGR00341 family protein [Coleofasciculus sp. LEGE 07092]
MSSDAVEPTQSMQRFIPPIQKIFPKAVSEEQFKQLHQELWIDASWSTNYVALTISSCMIATFGLISNSTAVIIGAMIVAPLMLPLRGLAFGALEGDLKLFRKGLGAIAGATVMALVLSWLTGHIVRIPEYGSEVLSRTQPNLVDLGIAVTAGGIGGFAKIRERISDALAGTAIAVALMPPLCVVGLALSQGIWSFSLGAFLLYLTNLLGITLACMVVFITAGYTKMNRALGWTMGLTALLFVPLGASFLQLVRQERLQATINNTLVRRTVTIGQPEVELLRTKVNWTAKPPIAYLTVQTDQEITPKQVRLVQEFISREMNQLFKLVFLVSEVKQVTAEGEIPTDVPAPPILDNP